MKVDEWVAVFRPGLRETTERGWSTYLEAVAQKFAGRELDSVKPHEIKALVKATEKKAVQRAVHRRGASAAEAMVTVCRAVWREAVANGEASTNPAMEVAKPVRDRARDRRALSKAEVSDVWDALLEKSADPVLSLLVFRLALETGLRRSEMLDLTFGDLLREAGCVQVTTRAKNGGVRMQPITQRLFDALDRLVHDRVKRVTARTPLLVNLKGEPVTRRWFEGLAALVRKEVPSLGVGGEVWFTWHLCRHTFGSAVERTGSYSIAAKALGHKPSVQSGTTVTYTGASLDDVRRTLRLIWDEEMAGPGRYSK